MEITTKSIAGVTFVYLVGEIENVRLSLTDIHSP